MKIRTPTMLIPHLKRQGCRAKHNTRAVSEIIGTILLLSISLALLCVLYLIVLNNASGPSATYRGESAVLVSSADENNVVLQNNGGVPLSFKNKLVITVGGTNYFVTVGDCVVDTNGDGLWSIGEQVLFTPPGVPSLYGLEIQVKIINPDTNTMIMAGLVQEGAKGDFPYIQTLNPYNIWPHSATLHSYYNFIKVNYLPGKLWFQWKRSDDVTWTRTPTVNITAAPLFGYHTVTLYNLTTNKNYLFEACIEYSSGNVTFNISGGIKLFTTLIDAMGIWHFNEPFGTTIIDSSGQIPPNNGVLRPTEIRGPQRFSAELNNSGRNLYVDGIDDSVEIPNSNTLSVTDECTIETWVNRSEYCDALVGVPLQSSLSQFGNYSLGCYEPYLINVVGDIFALVSRNEYSKGFLSTMRISDTGVVYQNESTASCFLDVFEFDTSCINPKIIEVSAFNGIYAIVYCRPSSANRLFLSTVKIYSDGRIEKTVINKSILDMNISANPDIIDIDWNTYAVVYSTDAARYGVLLSLDISLAGVISPVSHRLFFGDIMEEPEIIKLVSSLNKYVIVYNCVGNDGGLRTVEITDTGVLSDISGHVYFDEDDGGSPEIISIKNKVYAIVYAGPVLRQSVMIKTVEISSIGAVTLLAASRVKTIDEFSLDFIANNTVRSPHIVALTGASPFFAISYSVDSPTSSRYGKIAIISILDSGTIQDLSKKDCTFEPFTCSEAYLLYIANEVYGLVYRSIYGDGVIKTINIKNEGLIKENPILDMGEIGGLKSYAADEVLTSDRRYVANVYQGINYHMIVKTVKVNTTTKTIANAFTDSLLIEEGYTSSNGTFNASYAPTIIPINNDVYAIAYCHYMTVPSFHHGRIVTIQINTTGHIKEIERYTFDNDVMNTPLEFSCINKTNGFYALTYQRYSTSQGKIITVKIGNDGHIYGLQDFYIFDTTSCREPSLCHVNGDVYAIIYRSAPTPSTYGRLATLKIYGTNGTIQKSIKDLWQFLSAPCYHPTIIKVDTNIFAFVYVCYTSSRYIAYVGTVKIADDGTITKSLIDYLEFIRRYYTDDYLSHQPELLHVGNRVYAIISKDLPDPWTNHIYNGWITTLRIGENGDIIDTKDKAIQISTSPRITSSEIEIIPFVDDSYIAIYGGINRDLYQCIIRIPLIETNQTIFSKQDSYSITANKTTVFVTFTDSANAQYTLSAALENNWNHIVATYDKTTMHLYLNTNLKASLPLGSKPIKVTSNKLYFGPYNGYYDEFSLSATILTPAKITQNYNYYRIS